MFNLYGQNQKYDLSVYSHSLTEKKKERDLPPILWFIVRMAQQHFLAEKGVFKLLK